MAYTALPKSLTVSDRWAVHSFISDIRNGVETGTVHALKRYCPVDYCSDGYTPPNLDFTQCFLHSNTTALKPTVNGVSLKNLIVRTKLCVKGLEEVVNNTLMSQAALSHVIHGCSVGAADKCDFQTSRKKPHFQAIQPCTGKPGNSVFISRSMVPGLIKYTLNDPDKVSPAYDGRVTFEKGFRTEIGHSSAGCCHIVRVIVKVKSTYRAGRYTLVTAFPVKAFSPTS